MVCANCGMTKEEHKSGLAHNWHLGHQCAGYEDDFFAADREKRLRLAQGLCPLCGGETLPFDDDNPFGEKKSVCRERECGFVFYDASGAPVEAAYDGTDLIGR